MSCYTVSLLYDADLTLFQVMFLDWTGYFLLENDAGASVAVLSEGLEADDCK